LKSSYLALSHRTRDGGLEPPATEKEIEDAFGESCQKWRSLSSEKGSAGMPAPNAGDIATSVKDHTVKKKS
jgi:hypothetical protein